VRTVEAFADACYAELGSYLFHASDEFYLKAGLPLPDEARYEGYPQLENGVGMLTSFRTDFRYALADTPKQGGKRSVTVATGRAAYPLLSALAQEAEEKFDGLSVRVVCVENEFFGPEITVAGLLTGEDYLRALKGTPLGDALLISRTSLRAEGDLFLCGASLDALSEALGVPIIPVENDGFAFLAALLGNA
jgi:NifB/MoaA-like Fe-S oxidoreductase